MKCDICSTPLAEGQGTLVPIREMKAIARNRFGPKKLGIATEMDALDNFGRITPEQMDEMWRERVLADETPWLLCPSCYEKTRPFAGKGTEQAKASKKWWQFWK